MWRGRKEHARDRDSIILGKEGARQGQVAEYWGKEKSRLGLVMQMNIAGKEGARQGKEAEYI